MAPPLLVPLKANSAPQVREPTFWMYCLALLLTMGGGLAVLGNTKPIVDQQAAHGSNPTPSPPIVRLAPPLHRLG